MDLLSIRWRRPRRSQAVPEHNRYPATPTVVEYFPAWEVHFEQTRNATNRARQDLPENNVYPVTPPYTSWITHFEATKNTTNRRLITDLELDNYPATPPGYYTGHYPGSGLVRANRFADNRIRLELPELNTFPATPAPGQPISSWSLHFEYTRNRTNRRLLGVELNQYPVTPIAPTQDFYAGSQLITSIRIRFNLTAQTVPELNVRPLATSPATLPAFEAWPTFKHVSRYRLLEVLEINEYPETPPPEPVFRVGSMLAAKHVRRVMRRGR